MKVKKLNEYGTILLNITGADSTAVVELLDGSGKVLRQQRITPQNTADFYYLNPGTKFYIPSVQRPEWQRCLGHRKVFGALTA